MTHNVHLHRYIGAHACSCTGAREIRDPRETRISSELGTFMEQNATVQPPPLGVAWNPCHGLPQAHERQPTLLGVNGVRATGSLEAADGSCALTAWSYA